MLKTVHEELQVQYGTVTVHDDDMLAYLGMLITKHADDRITLTQPAYLDKLIATYITGTKYDNSKRIYATPMSTSTKPRKDINESVDTTTYLRLVGSLNFIAQCTRPDILFAMSSAAQKCSAPTKDDYMQAIRILLYLQSTPHLGLCFAPGKFILVCHVDAAHNCYLDAHGHYGFCFSLGLLDG